MPTYTINPSKMKLNNASQFVYSKKSKNAVSQSVSEHKYDVIHPPPRPEPLGDKQILRCLNFDCNKSRIFNSVNFKKLPNKIYKEELKLDGKAFRTRKKAKEEEPIEKEESEGDIEDKKKRKIDYYLDRKFDGSYHIDIAKNQAFKRPRDWFEWSG